MARDPRYILPNSLQHVVDVVHQNRYLLCPSEELNGLFLGVLGRAQRKYDMTICAAVALCSHYHLLLRPRDGKHLADFMCFLKTNLAKTIGHRFRGVVGHFFARRYHASMVSDEEAAQCRVLRYILSHGVKENLVDSVLAWPGVHSAGSMIDGRSMTGHWVDRSSSGAREGRGSGRVITESVVLSPLPCWDHLVPLDWRRAVRDMVGDIDRQAAAERRLSGKPSLGVAAVLAQDPYYAPGEVEMSPQPRFHAVSKEVLASLVEAWSQVLAAFATASTALRAGDRSARFPEGMFPPALPFVPFGSPDGMPLGRGQPL